MLITSESQGECTKEQKKCSPPGSQEIKGVSAAKVEKQPKKLPPPTPDRCERRLFPPEQSLKTSTLLAEVLAGKPTGLQ
jgi:hypothetical protein